ncbi:MAG TPA: hypothetical protein VGH03_11040, partial [Caulobacteraceae bacterium]
MAEGLFGGLFGGEDETPEEGAATSEVEGFAAAAAMDEARRSPTVARAIVELLRTQTRQLVAEHPLRLRHLHNQSREGKLRRAGQRIRLALQALMGLVLITIGAGLVVMLMDAFNSRSVIVEPFDAPPALAARGLSGKVIAGGFLDELTRLQASVHADIQKRNLSNAWTSDIKVEVPETGISVGDIDRMLKARFGHDLRVG